MVKNIVFRVDSSTQIGTGHLMRCLTLADELRLKGCDVSFIFRDLEGNLISSILEKSFHVIKLPKAKSPIKSDDIYQQWLTVSQQEDAQQTIEVIPKDTDLLIIDSYSLGKPWHEKLRPYTKKIMVIDDLADRNFDCDILLNQNYGRRKSDYKNKVPKHCQLLLGSKYALLRPEFAQLRKKALAKRKKTTNIKNILVSMGGADPQNLTYKVLQQIDNSFNTTVVLGGSSPHIDKIQQLAKDKNIKVIVNSNNMAQLMLDADLAIGAGGSTSWERCCLGLPALIHVISDDQKQIALNLEKANVAIIVRNLEHDISFMIKNINLWKKISKLATKISDGLGVKIIADKIYPTKKLLITIVSSPNSWINSYIPNFIKSINKNSYQVIWVNKAIDINNGDIAFYLSFERIVNKKVFKKNKNNIVVHESALPKGKGMSPVTWQILEGKDKIPITLFEMEEKLDSGNIYLQDTMNFNGTELINEIRAKQAEYTFKLCQKFLENYPDILHLGKMQSGQESFYKRRTPENSELDINKTIAEQFNLLRTTDNNKYPAFFKYKGEVFFLKIYKQ